MYNYLFGGIAGLSLLAYGKKYFNGGVNSHIVDLKDKVVIITGCNTGIGFETAVELTKMKAHVVFACRDSKKAQDAINKLKQINPSKGSTEFIKLDLADKKSIEQFADDFKQKHRKLDILINNAGVMGCPLSQTKDGFEMQIGVNHFGHFYLTSLLIDSLKAAKKSRVVVVSSRGHTSGAIDFDDLFWKTRKYIPHFAYYQSKVANVLFAKELNNRYAKDGITSVSLHPGLVITEIGRHYIDDGWKQYVFGAFYPLLWYFSKNLWSGAQCSLYCAVAPGLEKDGGKYFADCRPVNTDPKTTNMGIAKKLWELSEEILGIKFGEN